MHSVAMSSAQRRQAVLTQSADRLRRALAAGAGAAKRGTPLQILEWGAVYGPRAGALWLNAGFDNGALLAWLTANDSANARQILAWDYPGEPLVYQTGPRVRLEAGWGPELEIARILLRELNRKPHKNGRWTVGLNEEGATVVAALDDDTPHQLVSGTTGSGKTTALRAAALQLARDPANRLVVLDGKGGADLGPLRNLVGLVGPLATDLPAAQGALGWVNQQMTQRYAALARYGDGALRDDQAFPRLILIVDEFQTFTEHKALQALLRRVLQQGRTAKAHAILATQNPKNDVFGDDGAIMKANLPGRIALRVVDQYASAVALGEHQPPAHRLLGHGDTYVKTPGIIQRVQGALVDQRDFDAAPRQPPPLAEWPEFDPEAAGLGDSDGSGGGESGPRWEYSGEELALALLIAARGQGRIYLEQAFEHAGLPRPGSQKGRRLLELGRGQLSMLQNLAAQREDLADLVSVLTTEA